MSDDAAQLVDVVFQERHEDISKKYSYQFFAAAAVGEAALFFIDPTIVVHILAVSLAYVGLNIRSEWSSIHVIQSKTVRPDTDD